MKRPVASLLKAMQNTLNLAFLLIIREKVRA